MDDTKAVADDALIAKQCMHCFGCCVSGDIKVLGVATQQQVAHSAPYQVGLVAVAAQAGHDFESTVADVFAGYAMLIPGDDIQASLCLCRIR